MFRVVWNRTYLGNLIDVLKAGIETLKTVYNSRAVGTMNVEEGIQTDLAN